MYCDALGRNSGCWRPCSGVEAACGCVGGRGVDCACGPAGVNSEPFRLNEPWSSCMRSSLGATLALRLDACDGGCMTRPCARRFAGAGVPSSVRARLATCCDAGCTVVDADVEMTHSTVQKACSICSCSGSPGAESDRSSGLPSASARLVVACARQRERAWHGRRTVNSRSGKAMPSGASARSYASNTSHEMLSSVDSSEPGRALAGLEPRWVSERTLICAGPARAHADLGDVKVPGELWVRLARACWGEVLENLFDGPRTDAYARARGTVELGYCGRSMREYKSMSLCDACASQCKLNHSRAVKYIPCLQCSLITSFDSSESWSSSSSSEPSKRCNSQRSTALSLARGRITAINALTIL